MAQPIGPIGIVAGSAEGAALCYPTICLQGLGPHNHAEISIDSHAFAEDVNCIGANDWAGVADLLFSSSQKPANAGGHFLIAAGNTNYPAFNLVEHRWPRPGLHLAVEVAKEAKRGHSISNDAMPFSNDAMPCPAFCGDTSAWTPKAAPFRSGRTFFDVQTKLVTVSNPAAGHQVPPSISSGLAPTITHFDLPDGSGRQAAHSSARLLTRRPRNDSGSPA